MFLYQIIYLFFFFEKNLKNYTFLRKIDSVTDNTNNNDILSMAVYDKFLYTATEQTISVWNPSVIISFFFIFV